MALVPWASLPVNAGGNRYINQTAYEALLSAYATAEASRNGAGYDLTNNSAIYLKRLIETRSGDYLLLYSTGHDFTPQQPGGTLTAGVPATVTLSPVPHGINAANSNHYLYISGGTGTAEIVLITGGTAVSGSASGTVTFTPGQNHSGAWTVASATAGIQEAIYACSGSGEVCIPAGEYTIYANIFVPNPSAAFLGMRIRGAGRNSTVLKPAAGFPAATSTTGVFYMQGTLSYYWAALQIDGLTIKFTQPVDTTTRGDYTQWRGMYFEDHLGVNVRDVAIISCWDGIKFNGNVNGAQVVGCYIAPLNYGIYADETPGAVSIIDCSFSIDLDNPSTNQAKLILEGGAYAIVLGRVDHAKIIGGGSFMHHGIWIQESAAAAGYGFYEISGFGFDAYQGLTISQTNALIQLNGGYFSVGTPLYGWEAANGYRAIYVSKTCNVTISGSRFNRYNTSSPTVPIIHLDYSAGTIAGNFALSGCLLLDSIGNTVDYPMIEIDGDYGANVSITGNTFVKNQDTAYTLPFVRVNNSGTAPVRLSFVGNLISDKGTGSGTFLKVGQYTPGGTDLDHAVFANSPGGYALDLPAAKLLGVYQDQDRTYLRGVASIAKGIALVNGANHNVAISKRSFIVVTGPTGGFSIGGFADASDGAMLVVVNNSGQAMTILNDSSGSSVGNRIYTLTGADVVLGTYSAATFFYDPAGAHWMLVSTH